jgi:hypothetical protein
VTRPRHVRSLLAVAVLAVVVPWGLPAGAQTAPSTDGTQLSLRRQTPFVTATGELVLDLEVTGALAGGPLAVTVERFDDVSNATDPRGQLDAWLGGQRKVPSRTLPGASDQRGVMSEDIEGYSRQVHIPISPSAGSTPANGFTFTDAGVFPLVVTLSTREGRELDTLRTFLIRLPAGSAEGPPLRVATVLGLRAPVALKPDGTRQLTDDDRARLARAQRVLIDHPDAPVALDPTPETIAALDPSSTTLSPTRLRGAIGSRTVLSSTFVDIDIDRFVRAGLRDQVERQRQIGVDALVSQGLRTPETIDAGTVVARHPLGPEARAALQDMAPRPVSRLVVPADAVGPLDSRVTAALGADAALQPFAVANPAGRTDAVLSDDRLGARLTATDDPVVNAQAALADLAILSCGSRTVRHCNTLPRNARGVVLVVPDDVRAVEALDSVLTALATGNPYLEQSDLDGVFKLDGARASRTSETALRAYAGDRPGDGGLGDYPARLGEAAGRVEAYRSMLVPPPPADPDAPPTTVAETEGTSGDELPTVRADRLTQLLDVSGATTSREGLPAAAGRYLDEVDRRLDDLFAGVRTPAQEPHTLTSADGEVQVRVENRLDHPVTVQIQLTSDKPLFDGGRSTTVLHQQLPKALGTDTPSAASVPVPIHAVSSGLFALDVRVLSPDGTVTLTTTRIEVRSTVVSWVGLLLTVAAGVFLVVWWGRHFRDARRARKLVDVDEVDEAVAMVTGEVPAVGNAGVGPRV